MVIHIFVLFSIWWRINVVIICQVVEEDLFSRILDCFESENVHHCYGYLSRALSSSIGNLRSLYTVDLRNNHHIRLPAALKKLECLRHLLVDGTGGKLQLDILVHLETLKWIIEAKNLIRKAVVLKFTNLRNLGVIFETREEVEMVKISAGQDFYCFLQRSCSIHRRLKIFILVGVLAGRLFLASC